MIATKDGDIVSTHAWQVVFYSPHIIGASRSEPHTTEFYAFLGILLLLYILCIRTTSDEVRMRQMFHV